jgi:UDP-glucose:(heptosyl)LPS alpha-1,3-glucosyltransferase
LRLAIVSPFVDRRHGTERVLAEVLERLASKYGCDIHLYAQHVEDLALGRAIVPSGEECGQIIWHRVPRLPGPHLLGFLWWYYVNQALRWFHRRFRSLRYDLVFSPGINCPDADAIVAHIVFREFFRLVHDELRLRNTAVRSWPIILHRSLYYRLISRLENRIYRNPAVALAAVSRLTAGEITSHFARSDVTVIPNAVDLSRFNLNERLRRRASSRDALKFSEHDFVLLLVGNDWKKKGLPTLLNAAAVLPEFALRVLVAGRDNRAPFLAQIRRLNLEGRVRFEESSPDVMQFYAAADLYAGPSLHDSFALPPIEAMACGLPVITSVSNGGSQIITEGFDGFILNNPGDSAALAQLVRQLYQHPDLRRNVGENAARTAQAYTWERTASHTWEFLKGAHARKSSS